MKIRDRKDFNAGMMFILTGLMFVGVARKWFGGNGYPMGTAVRMGPAYFPTILGGLMAFLGTIILIKGFLTDGDPPKKTQWKPLLFILGSVVTFGLLVGPLNGGMVAAAVVIVIMSAFGGFEHRWKESIISAIFLTIACVSIFYYGLGLPFRLFPWS